MGDHHIAILGGGSVGLCLAASFAKSEAKVSLLVREASVAGLQGQNISVSGLLGEHDIAAGRIEIGSASSPTDEQRACDMLVVTTKAHDVEAALRPFARPDGRGPAVLLLQNGMGSAEVARRVMGQETPIYSTAMMIGMVRNSPTDVAVTAHSSPILSGALLGDDEGALQTLLALAQEGIVPMQHDPNIRQTISFKLLFNSCMNPTGALIGRTYGELLENPHSRELIAALAEETLAAYAAAWDYRPAENGQHYVDEVLNAIIFPRSAGHRSSMVQDLEAGRATEIDFLNGAVVGLAKQQGLDAPFHRSIVSLIHAREMV